MIKAVVFDLDGTLVQTEVLKARSYAEAIAELTDFRVNETQVMEIFGRFVGLSRKEVVTGLTLEFYSPLSEALGEQDEPSISAVLIERRLGIYHRIIYDPALLAQHFCPFNLGLFHRVRQDGMKVVLATMSHREQARHITQAMGIYEAFDRVLTRDEVSEGKPDPEIFLLAARELGLDPAQCLVIEDSVNGIAAAKAARMPIFAVTNDVTREAVHRSGLLDQTFIVDELPDLVSRVYGFLRKRA